MATISKIVTTRVYSPKVKDYVNISMDLEIDLAALGEYFGSKLLRSKSGRSVIQGGAIVATLRPDNQFKDFK